MKRQKFYLGILVVFLCLFLLGLWGLFFTGRFSLVADLILQPGIGARQEFKAQEILSESYFKNLAVKDEAIGVTNNFVMPELADISSQIESNLNLVLPADEPTVESKLGIRARRRNTHFVVLSVGNKTQNHIAPIKIRLPNISVENPDILEIYSYIYPQWIDKNYRYIYIEQLDPGETEFIPLITLGISQEKIKTDFLNQLVFYGKELNFSLEEDKKVLDCTRECNIKLGAKSIYRLGGYSSSVDAGSQVTISPESGSSAGQTLWSNFCSNLKNSIESTKERMAYALPQQQKAALFPLQTLYTIFCSKSSATSSQSDQNTQSQQTGQNFYLQRLLLRVENQGDSLSQAEIGIKINETDLEIIPFLGQVVEGIWYLPVQNLLAKGDSNNIGQINAWFIANKKFSADKIELSNLRVPEYWPRVDLFLTPEELEKLNAAGPDSACLLPDPLKCDKYSFSSEPRVGYFKIVFPPDSEDKKAFLENGIFVLVGDQLKKYQKALLVPYLSDTGNSDRLKKLVSAEGLSNFTDDKVREGYFFIYPQPSISQVLSIERLYGLQAADENFYGGDYVFYGIKHYTGLLWSQISLPQANQNYELSFNWTALASEEGKIIIQARSWAQNQFSPWVTLSQGMSKVQLTAGTEKIQFRIFFEASSPDKLKNLKGIKITSASWSNGTTAPGEEAGGGIGGINLIRGGLLATGTHLLLLLVVSIILIVSIVYIVALIKEK